MPEGEHKKKEEKPKKDILDGVVMYYHYSAEAITKITKISIKRIGADGRMKVHESGNVKTYERIR